MGFFSSLLVYAAGSFLVFSELSFCIEVCYKVSLAGALLLLQGFNIIYGSSVL
jgi:hypothetical protein